MCVAIKSFDVTWSESIQTRPYLSYVYFQHQIVYTWFLNDTVTPLLSVQHYIGSGGF